MGRCWIQGAPKTLLVPYVSLFSRRGQFPAVVGECSRGRGVEGTRLGNSVGRGGSNRHSDEDHTESRLVMSKSRRDVD